MFLATSNKAKQLLHFSYAGHVTVGELLKGIEEAKVLLAELSSSLRIVADLERLEGMEIGCAEVIGKMMEELERHGVELVIRIIPDPTKDIGFNIISRFHYHQRPRTVTFKTLNEAAALLAL